MVHHIPYIHDRGNRCWNSRVPRIVHPAARRLETLYSNSLKHPIYCTSEAVHSVRFSLPTVGRALNGLPFGGKRQGARGRKQLNIPPLETGVWLTGVYTTADKADAKMLGSTNTHAISRREELPPISTPGHGTATIVVNGVVRILGRGLLRPIELNEAYPPSRY